MKLSLMPHAAALGSPCVWTVFYCRHVGNSQLLPVPAVHSARGAREDMDMTPRRSDIPLQASQHIADCNFLTSMFWTFQENFAGRSMIETTLYTKQSMYSCKRVLKILYTFHVCMRITRITRNMKNQPFVPHTWKGMGNHNAVVLAELGS